MIELLVVLLIIGILSAIAAPLFLGNSSKAKVSEAVAAMGSIRSGERTYYSQFSGYIGVTDGKAYFGTGGANNSTLGVTIHGNKYFSPEAYTVQAGSVTMGGTGATATSQDFMIVANGSNSACYVAGCGGSGTNTTDGARNAGEVSSMRVHMDNSGLVLYSVDAGSNWQTF